MTNIGIFSKFEMAGGSEFRCAEMANSIARFTNHNAFLLAEKSIPQRVIDHLDTKVTPVNNVFVPNGENVNKLQQIDTLVVINTDCTSFTSLDYWQGRSERHASFVDLSQFKQMVFLFNFIVSPSRHLNQLEDHVKDIRIITANTKFFEEINKDARYENIRHFPRIMLESPIDPNLLSTEKTTSYQVRIGMHSKGLGNKWNDEWPSLIKMCNGRLGDTIQFDFMGIKAELADKLKQFPNVKCRKENEISVREYLMGIDIFAFFPCWKREEPWGRVVGEAMASKCPIITTDRGGNKDQVIHGHNGYLIGRNKTDEFFKKIVELTLHYNVRKTMAQNSWRLSKSFTPERISRKFIEFIED